MKKIFVLMLALISFVGCNNDSDIDIDIEMPSMWDEITMKMNATNLSALDVLKSADYWQATKVYFYTLPNAEGDEYCYQDLDLHGYYHYTTGGDGIKKMKITSDNMMRCYMFMPNYYTPTKCEEHLVPNFYWDYDLEIADNTITSVIGPQYHYNGEDKDETFSFRVLAYDENCVLIESNLWHFIDYGPLDSEGKPTIEIAYPYGRLLFERQTVESPDWFDQFEDRDAFYKWHEENCDKPLY